MRTMIAILLSAAILSPAVAAYAFDVGVSARAGTLGLGLELTGKITDVLNLRAGYHAFTYSRDMEVDDVDYESDLKLQSLGMMLDIHPFRNAFRFSAGVVSNGNTIEIEARPNTAVEIGDHFYDPDQVGTLFGEIDFQSPSGYLGIGFGNAVGVDSHFHFAFDLGVLFQGSLEARLRSSTDEILDEDLQKEEDEINDELSNYEFWPVVSLGLCYRF